MTEQTTAQKLPHPVVNRTFQLLGLLLIAVLSITAEGASATVGYLDPDNPDNCFSLFGCEICVSEDGECLGWFCPVGDDRGVGIICKR